MIPFPQQFVPLLHKRLALHFLCAKFLTVSVLPTDTSTAESLGLGVYLVHQFLMESTVHTGEAVLEIPTPLLTVRDRVLSSDGLEDGVDVLTTSSNRCSGISSVGSVRDSGLFVPAGATCTGRLRVVVDRRLCGLLGRLRSGSSRLRGLLCRGRLSVGRCYHRFRSSREFVRTSAPAGVDRHLRS